MRGVLPKVAVGELATAADPAIHPGRDMETTVRYLTAMALIAVLLVLLAGLWNMMRGTSPNLSQTLMRWRVGLQFLAIVIAMIWCTSAPDAVSLLDRAALVRLAQAGQRLAGAARSPLRWPMPRSCRGRMLAMVVLNKIYTRTGDAGTHRARHRRAGAQALRAHHRLRHGRRDQRRRSASLASTCATRMPTSTPCSGASRTISSISAPT